MADTKISALTAVATPAGTDEYATNQGGVSKRTTNTVLFTNPIIPSYLDFTAISDPSSAAAGRMRFYGKDIAGRIMPKFIGPTGLDTVIQPALFNNNVVIFSPQDTTVGTGTASFQTAWTSNGTVSHPTPSTTAPAKSNQQRRTRYANVVTTTNQQLGPRFNTAAQMSFWRGNAAGLGGFFFYTRFIVELWAANTCRIFAGLQGAGATSSVVISDTVVNNVCGLWHDTTDGGTKFSLVTRDATTTTKTDMTVANAIAAGNTYAFYMYCAPNGGTIYARLEDLTNGTVVTANSTTTLPVSTTFMSPQVQMSNGTANITVTTVAIGVTRIYVESDI